jgi:arylsulfatase A-like enzyme
VAGSTQKEASPPRAHREGATPLRALPEALIGAVLGVLFCSLADVVRCAFPGNAVRVSPGELALGSLHLVAMSLPAGLVLGGLLGVLLAVARSARFLGGVRRFYGSPRLWLRESPERFAQPLAWLGTLGVVFVLSARAYVDFGARFHRADLAGWAMGGVVVALVVSTFLVYPVLHGVFVALGRALGRLATFATLLFLAVPLAVGVDVALYFAPSLEGVDRIAFFAIPIASLCGAAGLVLGRALAARLSLRASWLAAASTVALVLALLTLSASRYGAQNRVRSVVEQRSLVGARLVRFYAARSDADRDGFSAYFGGGDCNDHDARVYPGARDEPGDGVDADCFAGDGSPVVVPHGDGRFGARPSPLARPNIVVVTIDALRRDHLGVDGYARPTSPHIDAFAAGAIELRGAIPSSSRSLRSIPGMWTGLYPSEIAWGPEYLWPSVLPENETVAEILHRSGYRSGAVMATNYFQRVEGFFQGFDTVSQFEVYDPPRDRAMNEALPLLEGLAAQSLAPGGSPFLLWVHLFNVHAPYLQDGVASAYGSAEIDHYDTEIGLADAQFQRILDAIDASGIAERTVVVLASDHGEAFGEHGVFYHSTTLYEEEMRPMLFVRVPGLPAHVVTENVSLLDLAPTLVELAGARMPRPISSESLVPLLTGERAPDPERTILAELLPDGLHPYDVKMLRRGSTKLLWWSRDGRVQLFDLAADPGELHDRSDDAPTEVARLLGELRAWSASSSRDDSRDDAYVAQNRLPFPPAPALPVQAEFPSFELLGLDLPVARVHRGEPLPLHLYYHVTSETDRDLFFRVSVEPPPGVALPEHFHCWHYPMHSRYPTPRWHAGEYLRDTCTLRIPTEAELPLTQPAHFGLVLQVLDGDAAVSATMQGQATGVVRLGGFDIEP